MNDRRKLIYGLLLVVVVSVNLYLTLQQPYETVKLSEGIRIWLEQFGYYSDFHTFRSNAHLIIYFVLGMALMLFGHECNWNWWWVLLIGCLLGFFDEGIKIYLPTREFDVIDLFRDWIGIGISGMVVMLGKNLGEING